jgi:hypothetical protein
MPKKQNPKGKPSKTDDKSKKSSTPKKKTTPKAKPTKTPKPKKYGLKVYWMVYRVVAQAVKEEKISWNFKKTRQFSNAKVYPYFKGQNPEDVSIADIKAIVYSLIGTASEFYNPLLIPTSVTTGIFWFDLDEFLEVQLRAEVDPLNLRFAVDAGQYGNTGIQTIKEYEFYITGLQEIYENIRVDIENASDAEWSGVAVVRDGYTDDGKADSYYTRFTLFINGAEVEPSTEREYGTSKVDFGTFDERKRKRKEVVSKQKNLAQKRRELDKQKKIKEAFLPTKKVRKAESDDIVKKRAENIQWALQQQKEMLADTERLFKEGIFTKAEFIQERKEIIKTYQEAVKRFEKGGEL